MFKNIDLWKQQIVRFLLAQTISLFGSSLVQYAIIWYITLSTSSGKMLTISTLCGFVPQILISLFAGIWIDRYDRKKLIMVSDAMIALATGLLMITIVLGYQEIWLLFVVLAVRSAGSGIQTPAVNAVLPQIVPSEHLLKVNGINSTLSSLMMFLSPAISGAILSVAPLETALAIDVVTAIIGISITATIKIKPYKSTITKNAMLGEIKAGFIYVKEHPFIYKILLYQIIILFLISPSAFLTPLMVSRTFGPEVWRLTFSEMTYSLGMVIGGLLVTTWGGFKKNLTITLLAGMLYGCLMIGLGIAPFFILYLLFNTMIGITSPCYNAPITVCLQQKVESNMHGRVFSLLQISTSCALPLGMALFGPIADYLSIGVLLFVSGTIVIIISLYMLLSKQFSNV